MQTNSFEARQNRLRQIMSAHQLKHLALNPGPTLTYLTGLHFHLMERPTILLFPADGIPSLILPTLEQGKIKQASYPLRAFPYGDDPATWAEVFRQAAQATMLEKQTIGVEANRWRFLELSYLRAASPTTQFTSADSVFEILRVQKEENEIVAMRKAVKIAQDALLATLPSVTPGVTERQLAAELSAQLLRHGSDSELPFPPIVASGENSADPHAAPTERRIQAGDLLLFDWGASYQGYISDLTRTFAIGKVDDELRHIAQIVNQANAAGRSVARPGVNACTIDLAAREVIEKAGYGQYFIHRTGHGIGLEAHEPPYIHAGNEALLATGMAFTIEPGIYLPGRGGVRIEDDVIINNEGVEILSSFARELVVLG